MGGVNPKDIASAVLGGVGGLSGNLTTVGRRMKVAASPSGDAEVFLIRTVDRSMGIESLLNHFDLSDYHGKSVALKANFNSADPFPASTHIETLEAIVRGLKEAGSNSLTIAERSGMGRTRDVLERMGVFDLSAKMGFKAVVLDDVEKAGWTEIEPDGTHWLKGFYIASLFLTPTKLSKPAASRHIGSVATSPSRSRTP